MNKYLQPLGTKKFWSELIIMVLGLLVGAAAVYYFLVPSKLIIGTISGFAIVVSALLENVGIMLRVSTLVLIMNAILIVLALLLVGKEFGIKSTFASLLLGPTMDFWDLVLPYTKFLTEPGQVSIMNDPWLDLCCFVLLLGASQAILFRINASTGGLDIVAMILNKKAHMDIGTAVTVSGAVICLTAFAIHPVKMVLIGIIGTWLNGLLVDYFTASLNKRKRVCIISTEHERIRRFIIEELVRGCSIYEVTGGYSGEKGVEIQALLTQGEFASLMKFVRDNEIQAFITAGNCSEVYGLWYSHDKQKSIKKHTEV